MPNATSPLQKFSILDLVRVKENHTPKQALNESLSLAQHAENWGYERLWVAEHHNFPGIASAATSVVISYLAGGTKTIRIGAGGIMLPNHSPMVIAEQFGTLAHLFPNRIDLGLGRAPGTDQLTLRALRRSPAAAENFPQDVQELQKYFSEQAVAHPIQAVPAAGTNVPLWILGSSDFGATLAAKLGLPYGFASHFAPRRLFEALEIYRRNFTPSPRLQKPYVMVGVNLIIADTDEEAKYLATSQQMSFADLFRGARRFLQAPIDDIQSYWSPLEKIQAQKMLACSFYGSPATVEAQLSEFLQQTQADEIIIVSDIYDQKKRLNSFRLIAESCKKLITS